MWPLSCISYHGTRHRAAAGALDCELPAAGDKVLWFLDWKDGVRLAASCPMLWREVERLVTLAEADPDVALHKATPDRLRIPLLTGLTAADIRTADNYALRFACFNGHLKVAQWLVKRFGLTAEDARTNDNYALRLACFNGHLGVVQWLEDRFGITKDEITE